MLAKKHRLTSRQEFAASWKGKKFYQPAFIAKSQLSSQKYFHLGVIISKKTISLATQRNLIKRRIKAIFQKNINKIKSNYSIIILPKAKALDLDFTELEKQIYCFITNAGLWK